MWPCVAGKSSAGRNDWRSALSVARVVVLLERVSVAT